IGGIAHRRDDDNYLVAGTLGSDHTAGNALNSCSISHRRAAVSLDDQAHRYSRVDNWNCLYVYRFRYVVSPSLRRPSNARPNVTSAAYSRSPPTGRPEASRDKVIPTGESIRVR